jgi:hypothetical protein
MKRTIIMAIALVFLLVFCIACAKDDTTDPAVGTWTLTQLSGVGDDGPYTIPTAYLPAEGCSLTIKVESNGTYTADGKLFFTITIVETGTWTNSGSTYSYASSKGTGSATISGATMTLTRSDAPTMTFTLTKS